MDIGTKIVVCLILIGLIAIFSWILYSSYCSIKYLVELNKKNYEYDHKDYNRVSLINAKMRYGRLSIGIIIVIFLVMALIGTIAS